MFELLLSSTIVFYYDRLLNRSLALQEKLTDLQAKRILDEISKDDFKKRSSIIRKQLDDIDCRMKKQKP